MSPPFFPPSVAHSDPTAECRRKPRGFAVMAPEQRREIASKGGKSLAPAQRSFSQDRALAAEAGRKGGSATRGVAKPTRADGSVRPGPKAPSRAGIRAGRIAARIAQLITAYPAALQFVAYEGASGIVVQPWRGQNVEAGLIGVYLRDVTIAQLVEDME